MPHEMFAHLYAKDKTARTTVFGNDEQRAAYWSSAKDQPWYQEHPEKCFIEKHPSMCTPLLTHGDDAAERKLCARAHAHAAGRRLWKGGSCAWLWHVRHQQPPGFRHKSAPGTVLLSGTHEGATVTVLGSLQMCIEAFGNEQQ